jgi:hypothetical protein
MTDFLPGNRFSFDLNVKGENTGKVYNGKFVMRLFLSLKQRSALAVEYSRRDIGNEKDDVMSAIIKSICELQTHCEEAPEWFTKETVWDLVDLQPIISIREKLEETLAEHSKKLEV